MLWLPLVNLIIGTGGVFLGILTLALYGDYFIWQNGRVAALMRHYAWTLMIATTIFSVALSLVYSEYFGFIPCSLCWLQRIAIYPQALLSILAYRVRDTFHFTTYSIALSLFGLLVAIYQYLYQLIPAETRDAFAPCLVDGSADCAVKVIDLYGFVTFPFLSAVTFAFLIIVALYLRRDRTTA